MEYKFYKEQGVLVCNAYSVKNSEIEKKRKLQEEKERLGISSDYDDDEKVYGEPIKMVIDFHALGNPIFFTPNKVELFEEENFVEGVYVEFGGDLDFVFLISFEEFKKLYFEYKGIN